MRNYNFILLGLLIPLIYSCNDEFELLEESASTSIPHLTTANYTINIDSAYTYPGDSLYNSWLTQYNSSAQTRALSPEDDAFFSKAMIVKSTEATLLYGRNFIYPGAILEGNSLKEQNYTPVFVPNRNPITVSMTLSHNTPKHTSRTIASPSYSKLSDYVKDMVAGGNFQQSEKFMFQHRRFTFYDEIKSAFGTNINTKKLFSSRKESSTEEEYKIQKSAGMYVKFYQSSFTVNMDIEPLSNQPITGSSGVEPVYVSSVTYGRLGVLVFETDETYEFAETCIKKEFDRIFYKKTTQLTEKEKLFFENTDFKVIIIGADSDYAVQSFKGYSHFLNLIYNSYFTEHAYGVPISCSFTTANTHRLVETEFVNHVHLEPLFVKFSYDNSRYNSDYGNSGNYYSSSDRYLKFYKDRQKTKPAYPYTDIVFEVTKTVRQTRYYPDYQRWPMIKMDVTRDEKELIKIRNIQYKSQIYVGLESSFYESTGKMPGMDPYEPMYHWNALEYYCNYYLKSSPFFIIIY